MSTNVNSMFSGRKTVSKMRQVPPYTSSDDTTWSPGFSVWIRVVVAAQPEEKQIPWRAPSRDARQVSSAVRVGFPVREYSYPRCPPTPSWA